MSEAPLVRLEEVAEINPPGQPLANTTPVSFVPMSAVSTESANVVVDEERRYGDVNKGYVPFLRDDLLVAKITPCFENGKIAQANVRRPVGFGSTEFHVVRPRNGCLDARYVLHFLRQERIRREGAEKMTGSAGQRRVPEHFLMDLKIPLPSIAEQCRMAELLDRADALRAKRRAAIAMLDDLPRAIYLEMFGDPVRNDRSWPLMKLARIGNVDRGVSKHRPRNAPELLGGPYPLVQTGDVANCDGYIRTHSGSYSEIGLRQSKIWPTGTLCITIAANIAKTGILTFDACFPDSVVGFRAEDQATVEYVRVWMTFRQKTLEESAPESAQKNINLAILRNLDVPYPPLQLQRTFASRLRAVERVRVAHRASLGALDALFASLQHRAFCGQL